VGGLYIKGGPGAGLDVTLLVDYSKVTIREHPNQQQDLIFALLQISPLDDAFQWTPRTLLDAIRRDDSIPKGPFRQPSSAKRVRPRAPVPLGEGGNTLLADTHSWDSRTTWFTRRCDQGRRLRHDKVLDSPRTKDSSGLQHRALG
jgi:hypothetical protein